MNNTEYHNIMERVFTALAPYIRDGATLEVREIVDDLAEWLTDHALDSLMDTEQCAEAWGVALRSAQRQIQIVNERRLAMGLPEIGRRIGRDLYLYRHEVEANRPAPPGNHTGRSRRNGSRKNVQNPHI